MSMHANLSKMYCYEIERDTLMTQSWLLRNFEILTYYMLPEIQVCFFFFFFFFLIFGCTVWHAGS